MKEFTRPQMLKAPVTAHKVDFSNPVLWISSLSRYVLAVVKTGVGGVDSGSY